MRIGFLTAPFREMPLEKVVKWAAENRFEALEVASGPGSLHIDPKVVLEGKAEEIKELLKANNVGISSLAFYTNPVDPDPRKREEILDILKKLIEAAAALEVEVVCTLAGFPMPGKDKLRTIEEDFAQVFPPVVKFAQEHKIKIALENWYATLLQNLSHWDKIFQVIPDENFGLNFDPSHLYWQEIDYLYAVEKFGKRIFHVHAKDCEVKKHRLRYVGNQGEGWWRYCIPGYGGINWAEFVAHLKSVGYDSVLSIEHEDGLMGREEGFIKGRNHLAQFI